MTLLCNVQQCGYYQGGTCTSPGVIVDEQGMCSYLRRGNWTKYIDNECKETPNILTIIKKQD